MSEPDTPQNRSRHNRPISDQLHPIVFTAMILLGLWYLLSAWIGFAADPYTAYLLVVSGLFFVAMAIPSAIWLASRAGQRRHGEQRYNAFREWASGEFKICGGQLKASSAAVQILLPLAAVAFGMTAFAVVAHLIELNVI
jgi:hypothetical protein